MSQLFATQPVLKGKPITVGLFLTNAGAGVDPVLVAGDVKIQRVSDGAPVNITTLPTKFPGAAAGAHQLTLAAAETDVVGPLLVQVVKAGVDTLVAYVDVTAGALELLGAIVEGANQVDGGGEVGVADVTLVQAIREALAYVSGSATGLDATNGQCVIKSRGGARNRIVANLVNGNRTVTSRDNS